MVSELPPAVRAVYPWRGVRVPVDGGTMHLIDEGPRHAPVIVAVHGNPTWSFYWRRLVENFSDRYRVIVPDHLGCGLSDKPQDWPYRLRGHVDNLLTALDALGVSRATFVVHDWGGAIGCGAATLRPGLAERLFITNTAAFRSLRIPPSIATVKIPGFGALAVRGFNGFAGVATIRATAKGLDATTKAGLLHPYGSWHDRIATLRFVQDIPLHPAHPSYAELSRIDDALDGLSGIPMQIAWGNQDFCFTPAFRKVWEARFPQAPVAAWDDVGHYVMEDAPDRVIPLLEALLQRPAPR